MWASTCATPPPLLVFRGTISTACRAAAAPMGTRGRFRTVSRTGTICHVGCRDSLLPRRPAKRRRWAGILDAPAHRYAPRMPEELAQLKEQRYKDPRPKEAFDHYHERTRTRKPNFVYEIVRIAMSWMAWVLWRTRSYHPERVPAARSEEHTSELQSRRDLVCRLLLEKK